MDGRGVMKRISGVRARKCSGQIVRELCRVKEIDSAILAEGEKIAVTSRLRTLGRAQRRTRTCARTRTHSVARLFFSFFFVVVVTHRYA